MRKEFYHWMPLRPDRYQSVAYMSGHLFSNYAITYSILSEVSNLVGKGYTRVDVHK